MTIKGGEMKLYKANHGGILGDNREIICIIYKSAMNVDCFAYLSEKGEPRYGWQSDLSNLTPVSLYDPAKEKVVPIDDVSSGDVVIKGISAEDLQWFFGSIQANINHPETVRLVEIHHAIAKQIPLPSSADPSSVKVEIELTEEEAPRLPIVLNQIVSFSKDSSKGGFYSAREKIITALTPTPEPISEPKEFGARVTGFSKIEVSDKDEFLFDGAYRIKKFDRRPHNWFQISFPQFVTAENTKIAEEK